MFNLKSCRSFFYVHVLFCVSFLRNIKRKGNSLFQFDGRVHKICDGVGLNLLSSTSTLYENIEDIVDNMNILFETPNFQSNQPEPVI